MLDPMTYPKSGSVPVFQGSEAEKDLDVNTNVLVTPPVEKKGDSTSGQ